MMSGVAAAASADGRINVPIPELRKLCSKSLKVIGYSPDEITVLLEVRGTRRDKAGGGGGLGQWGNRGAAGPPEVLRWRWRRLEATAPPCASGAGPETPSPCLPSLQVLMHAQLRDNNQGIVKITSGGLNRCACMGSPQGRAAHSLHALANPMRPCVSMHVCRSPIASEPVVEQETHISALINGNNSPGMLVLRQAVSMAAQRATSHGFGIVGTNHTASSTGAIG
jgi:hypothetical protein